MTSFPHQTGAPLPCDLAEMDGRAQNGGVNFLFFSENRPQGCQANLDLPQQRLAKKTGKDYYLPIFYFTELLGLALGHPGAGGWLDRHLVDPRPLLEKIGFR